MSPAVGIRALIRPATQADVTGVAAIEQHSFGDPWTAQSFFELLRSPAAIFLVATRDESRTLAGYIVALVMGEDSEILNLAVDESLRKQGLGGELLDAVLSAIEARGGRDVFLEVRESNKAALSLYRSRKFSPFARRRGYYRNPVEDALVLKRAAER